MVSKLFALASVSALTSLIVAVSAAACTTNEETPAATKDAAPETKAVDARPPNESFEPAPPAPNPCELDASDVPTTTYTSARVQAGACTENVFKVIEDLVASNDNATWDDLQTVIETKESKGCATCVFGGVNDDTWAPVIGPGDGSNQVNYGGCIEVVSGNIECAKAYVARNACLDVVDECAAAVQDEFCQSATEAVDVACGGQVDAYIKACNIAGEAAIAGPIRKQCIETGAADAGPG